MSLVKSRYQRTEDAPEDGKYLPMPCRQCGCMTPVPVLAMNGTLCQSCFQDYLRGGPSYVPMAFRSNWERYETATVRDMKTRLKGQIGNIRL